MRFIPIILRMLLGLMFIFSGFIKLFPIETFELTFVDLGIASWTTAPFIARMLIAMEASIGVLLVFGIQKRRMVITSLGLLLVFSVYLVFLLVDRGNDVNCGCFGQGIPMTPIESLFKNALFFVFGGVILYWKDDFIKRKWQKWVGIIGAFVCVALPFVLNPIQLSTATSHDLKEPFLLDITNIPKHVIDGDSLRLDEGEVIVAFLSVTCRHCKNAAYKLQIAKDKNKDLPRVATVFIGKKEKIDAFWEESNSRLPYVFFPDRRVYKITNGIFPTIFYLKDGYVEKHWTGESFTYEELEKLGDN